MSNVWSTLSKFDVSAQVEKKGRLTISHGHGLGLTSKKYPTATFEKHIFRDNQQDNPLPFMRDTKGHTP